MRFRNFSLRCGEGVKDGVVTVRLGGMDMEGPWATTARNPNNMMREAPAKVELALTLTAEPPDDADAETSFPLDVGSVMAKVTFTGGGDDDGGSFTDAFTDYVTVFNIRPAQCELLFPVVSVLPDVEPFAYNTAISVTNPAYEDEMASRRSDVHLLWDGGVVAAYDTTE